MNLTKDTSVFKYKNITIIGEVHGGIKEKGLGKYINKKDKTTILLECHKNSMDMKIKDIKKHYNEKIKLNKKNKDESYINNVINFFINKYSNILTRNKILKDVIKNKKIKLICLDDRKGVDYPKIQVRNLYKTDIKKIKKLEKKLEKLKKKIEKNTKIKKSTKNLLMNNINNILEIKLKKKSSYIFQTLSEIILDHAIIEKISQKQSENQNIIVIVGKNHLINLKKYLK